MAVEMSDTELYLYLKDEYMLLHKSIDKFDSMKTHIKGWSITLSMAAIVSAFIYKIELLFLGAAVSSVIFWFLEYKWRTYEEPYILRSLQIEDYFSGKIDDLIPLQIGRIWGEITTNMSIKRRLRILFLTHIMFPHAVIVFFGLTLFILVVFQVVAL